MSDLVDRVRWPLKEWHSLLHRMQEMVSIEHTIGVEFRPPSAKDIRKFFFIQLKASGSFYPGRLDGLACRLRFHAKEIRYRRSGYLKFIESEEDGYIYECVTHVPSTLRILAESNGRTDFSIEHLSVTGYAGKIVLVDRRLTSITHQAPCALLTPYKKSNPEKEDDPLPEEIKELN